MDYEIIASLLTLVALEIVLGIDNVVFISIISGKLPEHKQKKTRRLGLFLAMFMRLGLLSVISLIMQLKADLFTIFNYGFSGKDLILIVGGLFLMYKSTSEIYHKMEGEPGDVSRNIKVITMTQVIIQIMIMDIVFSLDSIITAVGLARDLWIMYAAIVISVGIMMFAAEPISKFVNTHPAFKILALSFLLLIGFSLMGEGFGLEIPKGYIYFAMFFSLMVDIIQMRLTKTEVKPVQTHEHYKKDEFNKLED
ncbi:MAG TPA: TerC family protein [Lentimicrobium sp.]|jgi:predicted tellurium resistance membrane protein TerC|nr:TerC family protein [Lentimicrobium sp.]